MLGEIALYKYLTTAICQRGMKELGGRRGTSEYHVDDGLLI
jgi:hypothetical protein